MTLWHFMLDVLHCLELGAASHAVANVFFWLVFEKFGHLHKNEAANLIWAFILEQYDKLNIDHGKRMPHFGIKSFVDPEAISTSYPHMRNLKAAEVKGLVPVVLQLLKKHGGQSPLEKHMTAMMTSLNQFYDLMQECPIVPGENGHMFSVHMVKFLVHYQWLAKTYFREDKKQFSTVPKHHYCVHLGQQAKYLNPSYCNCYGGEDYIGKMTSLGHACLSGTAGYKLSHSMMVKYRYAAFIRLFYHQD